MENNYIHQIPMLKEGVNSVGCTGWYLFSLQHEASLEQCAITESSLAFFENRKNTQKRNIQMKGGKNEKTN